MISWSLLAEVESALADPEATTFGDGPWPARIAIVAAGIALLGVGWMVLSLLERVRFRDKSALKTPEGLFQELCRIHHLSRSERALLADLNSALPIKDWCLLFIDPRILQAQCHGGMEVGPWVSIGTKVFGDRFLA